MRPEKKSILSECAYQGGGIPKKYIAERSNFINGYNRACVEWEAWLPSEEELQAMENKAVGNFSRRYSTSNIIAYQKGIEEAFEIISTRLRGKR